MDIGLPDTDGFMVTKSIRDKEAQSGKHVAIIALTAHNSEEYRKKAEQSGMDDFLAKPLLLNGAREMIEKHVLQKA